MKVSIEFINYEFMKVILSLLISISISGLTNSQIEFYTQNESNTNFHFAHDYRKVDFSDGSLCCVLSNLSSGSNSLCYELIRRNKSNEEIVTSYETDLIDGYVVGVVPSEDNSMWLIQQSGQIIELVKIDQSNQIKLSKRIKPDIPINQYSTSQIIKENDGGFYLMLSDYNFLGLLRFNMDGELMYSNKLSTNVFKSPGLAIASNNHNGIRGVIKNGASQLVVDYNEDGSVNWTLNLEDGSYRIPELINCDSDGSFFVAGVVTKSTKTNPYLHKYNHNGELIFAKQFYGELYKITALKKDLNGSIYLACQGNGGRLNLIKLSSNGDLIWNKGVRDRENEYNYLQTNSTATNEFITYENNEIGFQAFFSSYPVIVHWNVEFEDLCSSYNETENQIFNDTLAFEGHFTNSTMVTNTQLKLGFENSELPRNTDLMYEKKDFCNFISSLNNDNAEQLASIYPNPSNGIINIKKNDSTASQIVEVFDAKGSKVFCFESQEENVTSIDLSYLDPGIYFIKVLFLDNSKMVEKIILD